MSEAYVVHSAAGALRATAPQAVFGVVFAAAAWFVLGHHAVAVVALVALVGFALLGGYRAWTRLRVDARGIRLSFPTSSRGGSMEVGAVVRTTLWRDVRRLVLSPDRVQVVLRADAPMPPWLTSRVFDPANPEDGVSYARDVPGLDPSALDLVVRRVAPHVEVRHTG